MQQKQHQNWLQPLLQVYRPTASSIHYSYISVTKIIEICFLLAFGVFSYPICDMQTNFFFVNKEASLGQIFQQNGAKVELLLFLLFYTHTIGSRFSLFVLVRILGFQSM